ncbi:MAG: non-homologous end-joining DNA ligase [Erysipelotrichales bacterium]|nr:non-homologous end-joining DNA ligase [Erysipelotrichales bacterium]
MKETETKVLNIEISHPQRIIDRDIKKIDIIKYYELIEPFILPFLNNRPISEIRCHNGLKDTFFKKHHNNSDELIYVKDKQSLILECQNGTIEFHTYGYNKKSHKPDIMVFDLDPDDKLSLKKVRQGVLNLKIILDKLNLKSFLKTSGGKGYHVVIPFFKVINYKKFETFAKKVALLMEKTWPNLYTTNIKKDARNGKIFIDYLRNKKSATCIAPYSLRAREKLPISFPIAWEDLTKFSPNKVNIKNFKKYLYNNAWNEFFKVKQELI